MQTQSKFANSSQEEKLEEWQYIEDLVVLYQKQFELNATKDVIEESKRCADILIKKFQPLFKKYILLLKTGQIDFKDVDIKSFVGTFIDDPRLHRALKRKKSRIEFRSDIYAKFGFVLETYGQISEEEMLIDLQMLLLILSKRYKNVGKNFCAYVHNCYRFEISRHIKKYISNPINIEYKNSSYDDKENNLCNDELETAYEDTYHESNDGIPNFLWISGKTCGEIFAVLSNLERKIIVKYYIEEYNDKQIGECLGLHFNTANQKRRQAILKIAKVLNIDPKSIKRIRHSERL